MAAQADRVLVAHIFSQLQANVAFLAAQGYIPAHEADDIRARFATAQANSTNSISVVQNFSDLAVGTRAPPAVKAPAPAPPPRTQKAKATWAYNEDGAEPNDLSFSEGEIVEIIDETNADWWTGKCRGKQGLFPSSYVKKEDAAPSAPSRSPSAYGVASSQPSAWVPSVPTPQPHYQPPPGQPPSEKAPYRPFGAAYHGSDAPPPVGGTNSVGLQEADQEKKKSKYGKYGNTMAHSAAGGLGFGAGAAIGGGLVNAIF